MSEPNIGECCPHCGKEFENDACLSAALFRIRVLEEELSNRSAAHAEDLRLSAREFDTIIRERDNFKSSWKIQKENTLAFLDEVNGLEQDLRQVYDWCLAAIDLAESQGGAGEDQDDIDWCIKTRSIIESRLRKLEEK